MGSPTTDHIAFRGQELIAMRALGQGGTGKAYVVSYGHSYAVAKQVHEPGDPSYSLILELQIKLLKRLEVLGFQVPRVLEYSPEDGVLVLALVRGYRMEELEALVKSGALPESHLKELQAESTYVIQQIRETAGQDPVILKLFEPYGPADLLIDVGGSNMIFFNGYWWLIDP